MPQVLRHPREHLGNYLTQPHALRPLLRHVVLPWATLRSTAILVRGMFMHSMTPGLVLAAGSLMMQVSTWLLLALALPYLFRPYRMQLQEPQARALAAVVCAPLWLGGVFFVAPEEPPALFVVTRLLVVVIATYGLFLLRRALRILPTPARAHMPLWLSCTGAYLVIYLLLFTVVGITANILLYILKEA